MAAATSMRELASGAAGGTRGRRLYREDFWAWTREQAGALRRRDVDAIDWENLIEEVETLGRSEEQAWTSYCANIISHLLKIEHSGARQSLNHWRGEIVGWRGEMYGKLTDNPGMKGNLYELLDRAWRRGREAAVQKLAEHASGDRAPTRRELRGWQLRLPAECPYCLEDIAGYDPFDKTAKPESDVWPAPAARALNEELGADYTVQDRASERPGGRSR